MQTYEVWHHSHTRTAMMDSPKSENISESPMLDNSLARKRSMKTKSSSRWKCLRHNSPNGTSKIPLVVSSYCSLIKRAIAKGRKENNISQKAELSEWELRQRAIVIAAGDATSERDTTCLCYFIPSFKVVAGSASRGRGFFAAVRSMIFAAQ